MNSTYGLYEEGSNVGLPSSSIFSSFLEEKENYGRDRTSEFQSALRSLQGRAHNVRGRGGQSQGYNGDPSQLRSQRNGRNLEKYSQFMKVARTVGKNLSQTYTKLEKLALLAKSKSLFDDKSNEIQHLIVTVKQDLSDLNRDIAQLQGIARQSQRSNSKHLQSHSSSVVVSLQHSLASISKEFKQVLQVRTETLKEQRNRQDQFSQGPISSSLPPSAHSGYHAGSVLLAEESSRPLLQPGHSGTDLAIDMGRDSLLRHRPQQQSQLTMEDDRYTDSYLQSRADTMQTIESTIVELGGIFSQLAFMVKEQEETVYSIQSNVEEIDSNIEAAHTELIKYFRTISSNRSLMLKVFGLLIFFFILFVVFMT